MWVSLLQPLLTYSTAVRSQDATAVDGSRLAQKAVIIDGSRLAQNMTHRKSNDKGKITSRHMEAAASTEPTPGVDTLSDTNTKKTLPASDKTPLVAKTSCSEAGGGAMMEGSPSIRSSPCSLFIPFPNCFCTRAKVMSPNFRLENLIST